MANAVAMLAERWGLFRILFLLSDLNMTLMTSYADQEPYTFSQNSNYCIYEILIKTS